MGLDIKKYFKEFKTGTKKMFKEFLKKETNKKQRANMWTFSRIVTSFITFFICIISLFLSNTVPILISAAALTTFGAVTDYFDGRSARKHKSTSEYGKLLDQVADKVFSFLLGISLSILNPFFLITLLGEGIISAINLTYKGFNPNLNISSTQIGRIKEWPLFATLGFGFLSSLNPILNIISKIMISITFIIQIITAGTYIIQNNKILKETNKNDEIEKNNIDIDLEKSNTEKENQKQKTRTRDTKIQELKQFKEKLLNKDISKEKIYKLK